MSETEVWLYGSSARGDRDRSSDVDILVIGEAEIDLATFALPNPGKVSLSRYGWNEIEHMAGYGSLFLHHIRQEGIALEESEQRRFRSLLAQLGPYSRSEQELACFRAVLGDVEEAAQGDHSVVFELSVLATAARHACILGCYLLGTPTFGRDSAFRTLLPTLGYTSAVVEEVIRLYSFRRADDERFVKALEASSEDVILWVERIRTIIDQVSEIANNRD